MQSLIRSFRPVSRPPRSFLFLHPATQPLRFAGTYGNSQSGQEKSDAPNPREDLEHPGPQSPADEASEASSSSSSSSQPDSGSSKGSDKGSPAIHHPESAAETKDESVKAHNDDMRKRSDQSVNQLGEKDNKVNKAYWKGDVGPKEN